jgi:hydroxypyruvate isomerase
MARHNFHLNYAPHLTMFKHSAGEDPVDQIKYMADLGFRTLEDNAFTGTPIPNLMGIGMMGQTNELLTKVGDALAKAGMKMGTTTFGPACWPPEASFTSGKSEWRNLFLDKCRASIDVLKRLNGNFITVICDLFDYSLPMPVQTANVIEALRRACDILEPHNITLLLEPISFPPQFYGRTSADCYLLAKAVNRKSCKVMFDMYHLQINEGNLIQNMNLVWNEIAYFQIGDVPGRLEPTTGEVNYKKIFQHIYQKAAAENKKFIFGMEHYKSKEGIEGEKALIEAYLKVDDFL